MKGAFATAHAGRKKKYICLECFRSHEEPFEVCMCGREMWA